MLKFKFVTFHQLSDDELCTVPVFEKFSDGGNPIVRRAALIEIKPGKYKRVDLIADGEGLFVYADGRYGWCWEGPEGTTLNRVRELDKFEIIPYTLLENC